MKQEEGYVIRIRNVIWEDRKEKVEMCIEYEKDAGIKKLQVSGICTGCMDNQGFTEEWTFWTDGKEVYVVYSHFEETSFAAQVAEGIFRQLYPHEKDQISVDPGVV
ncbi:MAG: hypothetical protein Q4C66_16055 [Lachnospiraceae bacterium]|nr:hypothetical protein [Lachnospiraceae bacterium]